MARSIPSLNWLRVFEAAARSESFARAAEALAMSPPAVSQQIRALEHHLGSSLFHRHARRVELTEAGQAFLPPVRQALGIVGTASEALFPTDRNEVVTLQAVTLLALGWLPQQIAAFEQAHPGIRASLSTGNASVDFRHDRSVPGPDLQIVFGGAGLLPSGAVRLMGERLGIVARPDVAAAVSPARLLAGQRLIEVAQHDSGWERMRAALPAAGGDGRMTVVDSTPLAFALAAQGMGLALERAPASDGLRKAFGLMPVPGSPVLEGTEAYHLLYRSPDHTRQAVRLLHDWLRRVAAAADPIDQLPG